jgi:hypothetical protein
MAELDCTKSLICNITPHLTTNHCYINAKEEFVQMVVNFFQNEGQPFSVDEYRFLVSELLLQLQNEQLAVEAERGITFPDVPMGSATTQEELNKSILECRERVPELVARVMELNQYATNLTAFPDQLTMADRIMSLGDRLRPLFPRARQAGGSFFQSRTIGVLSVWLDHQIVLIKWDGVTPNRLITSQVSHLTRCRNFVETGSTVS